MTNEMANCVKELIGGLERLAEEIEKQQNATNDRISELEHQTFKNTDILRELANTILSRLE